MGTTAAGVVLALLSLALGAGGYGLILDANGRPAPAEPAHRRVPGLVVDTGATRCGTETRPRGTCFQPVIGYAEAGGPRQLRTRSRYNPAPHAKGDAVTVVVDADGAWLEREWKEVQAQRRREHAETRELPLFIGWVMTGCAAFGLLLALGLIFWVDRRAAVPPR
jgi:hypothetical protein